MEIPYREPAPKPPVPPDPYLVAWAELRRRRRLRWLVFFGWAPIAGLVGTALHRLTGAREMIGALPIWAAAFVLLIYYGRFDCPRCGKSFSRRGPWVFGYSNPWTQSCLSCGIDRGTAKG